MIDQYPPPGSTPRARRSESKGRKTRCRPRALSCSPSLSRTARRSSAGLCSRCTRSRRHMRRWCRAGGLLVGLPSVRAVSIMVHHSRSVCRCRHSSAREWSPAAASRRCRNGATVQLAAHGDPATAARAAIWQGPEPDWGQLQAVEPCLERLARTDCVRSCCRTPTGSRFCAFVGRGMPNRGSRPNPTRAQGNFAVVDEEPVARRQFARLRHRTATVRSASPPHCTRRSP